MKRRQFLWHILQTLFVLMKPALAMAESPAYLADTSRFIRIFLCGDVMTGRGIDQVLAHPCNPHIHEPYVKDARQYVELAETVSGPIPKPVAAEYIWGDALTEFEHKAPDARIINLETSITQSDDYWKGKSIHYRMHPDNITCITSAGINCCVLANNHVMDWGYSGLKETIQTLHNANLQTSGAGLNRQEAAAPAIIEVAGKGRIIALSMGMESSGIGWDWSAKDNRPGVNLLFDLSSKSIQKIREQVVALKRAGDVVIASIHWGGNWGYEIPAEHSHFVHRLIDEADIDLVHGHSSHHAKGMEVYRDKLIIYGCGDFINDYEGISGYESYRDDLTLMYFADIDIASGKLIKLDMIPLQICRFRLNYASQNDVLWLKNTLQREGQQFKTSVEITQDHSLTLRWT